MPLADRHQVRAEPPGPGRLWLGGSWEQLVTLQCLALLPVFFPSTSEFSKGGLACPRRFCIGEAVALRDDDSEVARDHSVPSAVLTLPHMTGRGKKASL